jgi:hypothetical protein
MKLGSAFNNLDELLKVWLKIDSSKELDYYVRRNKSQEKSDILHDAHIVDNKCSALLSHISLMFIVLGVFIGKEDSNSVVYFLLVFEFIAFLISALLILRCQDLMGPPFRQLPESDEEINQAFLSEITLRRGIYARVLRLVYILTLLLIPIVLLLHLKVV